MSITPHEWWVINTSFLEYALVVQCPKTNTMGIIEQPTLDEWRQAYAAQKNPYPLEPTHYGRVQIVEQDPVSNSFSTPPFYNFHLRKAL